MPDLKISQLPVATTPLAGTELVPIVQGGTTDQTTVQAIMTSTVPSGTANGVLYLNGSKVATSGSALTFDGTNLGLGTNSPATILTASLSSSSTGLAIAGGVPTLALYDSSGTTGTAFIGQFNTDTYLFNKESGGLIFGVNNTEQMRLTSTGLGIGTSSPWSQLTVGAGGTANPASTVSFHKDTVSEYRLKLTSSLFNSDGAWLGLGFGYSDNYMKAAIIAEAKDANARANLHFALNDAASNANASLSDSKMVLTYAGNLGLGVTPSASWSGQSALQVNTRSAFAGSSNFTSVATNAIATSTGWTANYLATGTAALYTQSVSTGAHAWYTAPSGTAGNAISFTQAMTLDASGNLTLGQTSSALQSGGTGITIYGASASEVKFLNSTTGSSATDGTALVTSGADFVINNREAGAITFGTNNTERARVTSAGDLITNVNGTAPSLSTNSTMSFELTSNTSLKIVVRGTDGVTRSVSLTLA